MGVMQACIGVCFFAGGVFLIVFGGTMIASGGEDADALEAIEPDREFKAATCIIREDSRLTSVSKRVQKGPKNNKRWVRASPLPGPAGGAAP